MKDTPAEAEARVEYLEHVGAEPLVQRFVQGDLVAQVAVTDRDSQVVAAVQQRASAVTPGGGTARGETEALDPSLAEGVAALLEELNWFGLAQVQFQVPPGGEPVLIDLNGRFYGSMALVLAAGLNLPAIWAALATDRPLPAMSRRDSACATTGSSRISAGPSRTTMASRRRCGTRSVRGTGSGTAAIPSRRFATRAVSSAGRYDERRRRSVRSARAALPSAPFGRASVSSPGSEVANRYLKLSSPRSIRYSSIPSAKAASIVCASRTNPTRSF